MFGLAKFGEVLSWLDVAIRLSVVILVGTLIGVDREAKNRPAGTRTHVLVGVGAAIIAIIEQQTVGYVTSLGMNGIINVSVGRITSTVVSGVGFLGAGTIVMSDRRISGLTTAASLWCMACIGLAAGYGFLGIALFACVIILVVLKLLPKFVHVNTLKKLEVKFVHRTETLEFLNMAIEDLGCTIIDVDFHAENRATGNLYTNVYTLSLPNRTSYTDIINRLSEYKNIQSVRTRNM